MTALKQAVRAMIPAKYRTEARRFLSSLGNRYVCPCCQGTFSRFWPSGVPGISMRENTLCPGCSSLERHRLLWLYLKDNSQLFDGPKKVLHVAPEPIFTTLLCSFPEVDYISADLDSPLAMLKMDLTNIELPDNSFDAIICYHVLEHIPDDLKAMRELHRVLKPGGWSILQSPLEVDRATTYEDFSIITPEEREQAFKQRDHVRIYGLDYKDRLVKAGFVVTVEDFGMRLEPDVADKYRIDPQEAIYFCMKKLPSEAINI